MFDMGANSVFLGKPNDLVGKQPYADRHPDLKAPPAPIT
jgi:hypothetical protein